MYPGQHMSIEDNIFYAKRNIVDSIWKEANIEGIDITFPATKAVFEGAKIANLTQDQTTVINNLKHGWQFIFDFIDAPIDLSYVRQVHQLVSNNLVPDSGQLRYFWRNKLATGNTRLRHCKSRYRENCEYGTWERTRA